jgi:N-acetylglucosaminyl-diphospho-decaprenol L-rhamnosyltransferase
MDRRIDVVVVSYNSRDTLRGCVEPLVGLPGVSVTVIDNASPDRSLEAIADLPVQAIDAGRNGGFGFGCNLGMAAGSAPFVLFLNPDARIDGEGLARLAAALEAEPAVAIVGPRLLEEGDRLVRSMRRYQRAGSTWAQALFLHRLVRRAAWANEIIRPEADYKRVAYPEWLSGACMLGRRAALEPIGGFDEGFFLYCEDMDLCARLHAAGHEIRYEPGVAVHHEGGRSAPRTALYAVLARSRMRFAREHSGALSALLQRAGLAVHATTHLVAAAGRPARARGNAAALREVLRRQRPAGSLPDVARPQEPALAVRRSRWRS